MIEQLVNLAPHYIDAAWIPVLALILRKGQRLWAALFVVACMVMMRLMIDFMVEIGYPRGVLGLTNMPLFMRGLWTYGAIYVFYAVMARAFPGTKGIFLIASSLTLFFIAAILFAGIMIV